MRISPVSFGKTVRVLGNRQIAQDMVQLANAKKTKAANTVYQKEIKKVFDDIEVTHTNDSKKAILWETYDGFYILSGSEAKRARKFMQDKMDANLKASEIHCGRVLLTVWNPNPLHHVQVLQVSMRERRIRIPHAQ